MKKLIAPLFVILLGVTLLAASYSDTFDRANAGTLGADWTDAVSGMQINSNAAAGDSDAGDYDFAWWDNGAFANDQYSEGVLGPTTTLNAAILCIRCVGTSEATLDGYAMFMFDEFDVINLYRLDDGVPTQIGAWESSSTFAENDVYKVQVIGTTFRGYRNSVELSGSPTTDGTYSSGAAGVGAQDDTDSWKSWAGADIGGATPNCLLPLLGVGC